ncbi:hypothetical protein X737_35635 [Mesorhizobium sp. L48C026A00]|nr:hypothetical protein X737_35635 [Mesorhizobium sp. L48C026A00]
MVTVVTSFTFFAELAAAELAGHGELAVLVPPYDRYHCIQPPNYDSAARGKGQKDAKKLA